MKGTLLIIFLVAIFAAGCSTADTGNSTVASNSGGAAKTAEKSSENIPFPEVERISLEQAKQDFDAGNAVFIDTHSASAYEKEHIAGAINVPVPEFEAKLDAIPKGKKIIAYCS